MSLEEFRIRNFRSDDLNTIMEINFECLPENYSSYFYKDLFYRFPKTFLVAELNGSIKGYMMCRIEKGLSKLNRFKLTRLCHVVSIAVREKYRRKGIATALMLRAMKNGKEEYGADECYLEVRVSNQEARGLYEKLGFIMAKQNKRYYMDGEDAWVMAKTLLQKS